MKNIAKMSIRKLMIRTVLQNRAINALPLVATHRDYSKHGGNNYAHYGKYTSFALFSAALIGSNISDKKDSPPAKQEKDSAVEAGAKRPDLPTFRAEEVNKHNDTNSFWVTYKHGVYDVTSFLPSHPGGEQILNAAGLSIEPFWNVYGMHRTTEIYTLLESYRIGNLHDDDVADHSDEEMWAREPRRDRRLLVKTARPFNAETPSEYLIEHFDTPNELFYVRQHMPVPELDAHSHALRVEGVRGGGDVTLTMAELARFPQATVRAALMCAGNRRSEMNEVKEVKGLSWGGGAIGCAAWRGVPLRDVLLACGVTDDDPDIDSKHVILYGADIDATGEQFNTSIPLRTALDPAARVLLATHMNGAPLPPDHGRPLRAVVPGAPAVRSVKWLDTIRISTEESSSHWHRRDYRSFGPSVTWDTADWGRAPPLYSLPVTAAASRPLHGHTARVRDGRVDVAGYAFSGGGAAIVRVEVSADRGRSWTEAALRPEPEPAPPRQHYAWTLWSATVPVADDATDAEIWVKATDSNFNTQPENFDHIWNIRGILANAYHKIKVTLQR